MKSGRLFLTVAALLGASACECGSGPGQCFTTSGGRPMTSGSPVATTGETHTFEVMAALPFDCDNGASLGTADSVSVEVYGPDNLAVPAEAQLQAGSTARVTFTPSKPGRYHALVSFAPVGGVHQQDVFSAVGRSQEQPVARLATSWPCLDLERTARDTWLCGGVAMRDGATLQVLGGDVRLAVAGDVVWTVDANQVKRYVDTGTELKLTGTLATRLGFETMRLAAEDELLVLAGNTFTRITFTEAQGLTPVETVRWQTETTFPVGGADSLGGVLVRAGPDRLLVAGMMRDTSTFSNVLQACAYERAPDSPYARTAEPCQLLPGSVVGFEDGVLWTSTSQSTNSGVSEQVHRLEVVEGLLRETGSLVLGGQLQVARVALGQGPTTPMFLAFGNSRPQAVARWDASSRELGLELLPTLDGGQVRASARYLWGPPVGGMGTWVYARASTP